jgi:hypothetical protein
MTHCNLCDTDISNKKPSSCLDHSVLLADGTTISAPTHPRDSLTSSDQCPDCAVQGDGVHHPGCDIARTPDDTQLLGRAVCHWVPDRDPDPRAQPSPVVFIVGILAVDGQSTLTSRSAIRVLATFSALEPAHAFISDCCTQGSTTLQIIASRVEDTPP